MKFTSNLNCDGKSLVKQAPGVEVSDTWLALFLSQQWLQQQCAEAIVTRVIFIRAPYTSKNICNVMSIAFSLNLGAEVAGMTGLLELDFQIVQMDGLHWLAVHEPEVIEVIEKLESNSPLGLCQTHSLYILYILIFFSAPLFSFHFHFDCPFPPRHNMIWSKAFGGAWYMWYLALRNPCTGSRVPSSL